MEQRYLIDSNVIIDHFGNKLPVKTGAFLNHINIIISAVTQIEVLGWQGATKQQLKPLYAFMQLATILPLDEAVIAKTIEIRQSRKIALGDALITSTALVYDLVLISRNISDFRNINGLQVIDSYNL